ncbi:hypothetical protein ZYGM_004069 [Zygosaccharomyces mellis]|uniref:Uncharacterized protein n=1 Tax=Zygosaccharomyces mellis TaxID=42258 RepID=A0A4C2E0G8_9SACH|nr:hypothetical protein ZYGM_004069 [Zygosaccharomyces mellis]
MYSTPLKSRIDYNNSTFAGSQSLSNNGANNETNGTTTGINGKSSTDGIIGRGVKTNSALVGSDNTSVTSDLSNAKEHLRVNGLGTSNPLELSSQYIDHLQRQDASTPVLDERSYYNNGVNYNFSKEVGGLGAFTPFERQQVINLPDEILQEASKAEMRSDMGIFPEISRCWIIIDNKLILWNIKDSSDFQTIDEIKHTILKVALVKPKPNMFVDYVQHLLLISTPFDIYILAVSHDSSTNEIGVFNTGMCVSVHGLDVAQIVCLERTGQIFFSGRSNGLNIWELQYSGSDDWFNSKCNKVCLTQSAWSSLLPGNIMSKLPGSRLVQSFFEEDPKYSQETIVQLAVDQSRGIVYSLSSKSNIKAYLITDHSLEGPLTIEPFYIKRIMGTTTARGAAILGSKYLKISKIETVSQRENNNLFFVAITIGGVRLYFNGSVGRSSIEALRLESIKFPPSSATQETIEHELQQQQLEQQKKVLPFYSFLNSSESILLKFQKKSSVLLETSKACSIISPGMFFCPVIKHPTSPEKNKVTSTSDNGTINDSNNESTTVQHKLYVSVPDYGILKNHGKYVENTVLLDTTGSVKQIVPLTPSFNATQKPEGYANEFATQYSTENMKVAVLTNGAIEIYRYRTPDEAFETLIDNPLPFVLNYGVSEACSTALFVTCKLNKSEMLRSAALTFFTVGIPGVVEIKPKYNKYVMSSMPSFLSATPQKTLSLYGQNFATPNTNLKTNQPGNFDLDDVVLSARFYGIAFLIARLFRDIWDKQVFEVKPSVKFGISNFNYATKESTEDKSIIVGTSISTLDVEYYLSSITILNEFFNSYGDSITTVSTGVISNGTGTNSVDKSEEVANQAENIAINSLMKLVKSIMEALSFLNVLYEESEVEGYEHQYLAFKDIIKFLNLDVQKELTKLKFKDLFAPNAEIKRLIREILSSIINRSITRGASIEYTATALQERCGSFCSSSDILGFRAVEHLRRAKEIGLRDYETLSYHLNNAIKLFERIVDDISIEKLKEAVNIMLELHYFPKTIKFLLNMANSMDRGKLAYQFVTDGSLEHDDRKKYYEKRSAVYELVFETLVKVDELCAADVPTGAGGFTVSNELNALREESYSTVLHYNDKLFHYQLYDWLVSQSCKDKLLQLDTEFILSYLQENSKNSLEISNLLWIYYSKRSKFLEAAEVLYTLAGSDFKLKLGERIECLSRANGFCNSVCPPSQKQNMVQLADMIQEIFDVAAVQDDLLTLIATDSRVKSDARGELLAQLDGKILPVSDLFNDFAVPLGYYEICLFIFKISDFRNEEEIITKWKELFESLKQELNPTGRMEDSLNFINFLSNVVIKIGRQVHTSEFVFPVTLLFPIISNLFYDALPHDHLKAGSVASIFISVGLTYGKLYYFLKDLIETSDSPHAVFRDEMTWLIKEWYKSDRKLRDIINYESVAQLDDYTLDKDPIEIYMKESGNTI